MLFSLKATLNKTCLWGWPNGICSSESSHDGWRHPYTRGGPLDKCEILRVGVHFIPYCWWIKFCEPKQNTGRLNCAILTANKTMAFPAILHQIHHGCIGIPGMQLVQRLGFFGDWLGLVFESLLLILAMQWKKHAWDDCPIFLRKLTTWLENSTACPVNFKTGLCCLSVSAIP